MRWDDRGRVLWMCPVPGVDPVLEGVDVDFACVHSAADLLTYLTEPGPSSYFDVAVIDAMPTEQLGYDPSFLAGLLGPGLTGWPRHVVYVIRHDVFVCPPQAQAAFAVEVHDIIGGTATFVVQLASDHSPVPLGPAPGGGKPDEKPRVGGRATRWQDIAEHAADLARDRTRPTPSIPHQEAVDVTRLLAGDRTAVGAVLLALALGTLSNAGDLAAATGYSVAAVRSAVRQIASVRHPDGGPGHWTFGQATLFARDYGPWLRSRHQRDRRRW